MMANLKNQVMPFVIHASRKWPVHPDVMAQLICDLSMDHSKLIKQNNFFAIAGPNKKFHTYSTPIDGIDAGMHLLTNNPQFTNQKIGTLKGNPKLQLAKIRMILGIQAK